MRRLCFLLLFCGLACLATTLMQPGRDVQAQGGGGVQWIWFDEGDPLKEAPAETRYFRRTFTMPRPFVDEAELDITADNAFTVWINGVEVGSGDKWERVYRFDVKKHIVNGVNVIAVQAKNTDGPAGMLVRLGYVPNGQSKEALVSDGSWKASKTAADGWQKPDFAEKDWKPAKALGRYGEAGPWKNVIWDAGGNEQFTVPPGFEVQMVVPPNPERKHIHAKAAFSLINLTFDDKGRLLVAQESSSVGKERVPGPILLCTDPDKKGVFQTIKPYCTQVANCQGMCWVKDSLYLVGDGPKGTGLYRARDTNGDDQTDEVTLLHKFLGGMGEHGPHAILHGPDGWLYLVIGNHAWAQPEKLAGNSPLVRWPRGLEGPDQFQAKTTEDVLLKRLNDSRGHAADRRAPGGTIWRLDTEGKNFSLVAGGFRNHYDAAFSPTGELFTFDSDMEWDEGLPWYRAVRVCHCTPGADFVWRTGAANTPNYYLDSLPPTLETGRGSPVGVEFYDHNAFPEKYRGAFFMADWAIGTIFAVHLEKSGATYKAKSEKFCRGAPMNVTDLAVGPDGALYFTLGGRGTTGGVYRIVAKGDHKPAPVEKWRASQPLAAYSRAKIDKFDAKTIRQLDTSVRVDNGGWPALTRISALNMLHQHGAVTNALLHDLGQDKNADIRAHAVWMRGMQGPPGDAIAAALKDEDKLVRRRACEALIRAGVEPPVEALWPLLGDQDLFLQTAARLVLERIDPKLWAEKLWKEADDRVAFQGIVALCKIHRADANGDQIFARLNQGPPKLGKLPAEGEVPIEQVQPLLDYLRTVQLALVHCKTRPSSAKEIGAKCFDLFPHRDWRVNRELAIILTHLRASGPVIDKPVHTKLLAEMTNPKNDRMQQIHFFYCLRFLHEGWSREQKDALMVWYDGTSSWQGGFSFTPFLENILRDANPIFTTADRERLIVRGEEYPTAATFLLRQTAAKDLPWPEVLSAVYYNAFESSGDKLRLTELREALVTALGRSPSPDVPEALRKIADKDPSQRDAVARGLAKFPSAENYPYLVRALDSPSKLVVFDVVEALKKTPTKPKPDDPTPFRAAITASARLDDNDRWKAVELLRHWTGRRFGADDGQWKVELSGWSKWFVQNFPKEPKLADVTADKPIESKYKFEELQVFLEKDPSGKGDATRGRAAFEKAQCLKCHKYGKEGEALGPDLTALSKRFKRVDTLEAIYYPSKVISDQYRSVVIITDKGLRITGLKAEQGNSVIVLQPDGTKATLRKDEIDKQYDSLTSGMPDKLLDLLTKQEIADLFAFLESEPK